MHRIVGFEVSEAVRTGTSLTLFFINGSRADWSLVEAPGNSLLHVIGSHVDLIGRTVSSVSDETYRTLRVFKVVTDDGHRIRIQFSVPARGGRKRGVTFRFTPRER